MKKRRLWLVDLILLVGSLAIVFGLYSGFSDQILFSPSEIVTTESDLLFELGSGVAYLDIDPSFPSPREFVVEDNLIISLEPGEYYLRFVSATGSETRKLTILSKVDLRLEDLGDGNYGVTNAGNVNLDVDVFAGDDQVDSFVLKEGATAESSGDKFLGRQSE